MILGLDTKLAVEPTLATEEVQDTCSSRVGEKSLNHRDYNVQAKQRMGNLSLYLRVGAKTNVGIKQNPGYGLLTKL